MQKLLTSAGVGASLLVLAGAAYADGYSAPRGYERPFSWTGVYIGLQGGAGWGTTEDSVNNVQGCIGAVCGPVIPITPGGFLRDSYTMNGFHGGGTIGANLQTGVVVVGLEADISGANISGTNECNFSFGSVLGIFSRCRTDLNAFGTVTGRLGLASGRTLVYGKAGLAWGNFDRDVSSAIVVLGPGGVPLFNGSRSETRTGFTVGAGIEHALGRNWSAKLEYDFMDFGSSNETLHAVFAPLPVVALNVGHSDLEQVHVVRLGINYKFGSDPGVPLK